MANYIATKSYLISFGEALHHEFKNHGVDVLVLSPGLMNTDPDNTREPDVGLEKPDSESMGKAMPVAPVENQQYFQSTFFQYSHQMLVDLSFFQFFQI